MDDQRVRLVYMLTCGILAAGVNSYADLRPAGVKICDDLCFRTIGCYSFQYSETHLSCRLLPGKSTEQRSDATPVFDIGKNQEETRNLRWDKCRARAKIFQSKTIGLICRIRSARSHKILIIKKGDGDVKQLSVKENIVSQYLRSFKGALVMAYIPMSNKLVFSDCKSKLQIASVDGSGQKFIKDNCLSVIGVAEDRVFIFTKKSGRGSFHLRMSPYGTNITKLRTTGWYPECIAVDMKRSRVYISTDNKIYVYRYPGKFEASFKGQFGIIEPFSDWMYIADHMGEKYYRKSLVTKSKNYFQVIPNYVANNNRPCVVDDTLYALTRDCDIVILSKTNRSHIELSEKKNNFCTCCVIP